MRAVFRLVVSAGRLCRPLSHSVRVNQRAYSTPAKLPSKIFQISDEVRDAVHSGKPVVALETTIYTHGFPYPDNVALASHLESVVRVNGGIPATIGVLDGVARVGLSPEELIQLASAGGEKTAMKVSRRDLPYITGLGMAGKKLHGGTTIAGTMILAHMAGIEIFGTGGLGGVHRGGEHTMDVSADLTELGRTPVTVISSGPKSFLDIQRTLEYLETQGVLVSTFADGRSCDIDLPAFYTRESGIRSPSVIHDEKEAAAIIYALRLLNLQSGLFFANPIPEEFAIPKAEIDKAIEEAVYDAQSQGVYGHANTPFILNRIKEITQGRSIPANRALIESNVARATKVAAELSRLGSTAAQDDQSIAKQAVSHAESARHEAGKSVLYNSTSPATHKSSIKPTADILVAGSVAVDLSCDYAPLPSSSLALVAHTSNPAVISQAIGGVGHNVATAAHLIGKGTTIRLASRVADDLAGNMILSSMKERAMDITAVTKVPRGNGESINTAQYVAINGQDKALQLAMADMRIISSSKVDTDQIIKTTKPKWVVVDANWDQAVVARWIKGANEVGARVAFEPVSVPKSTVIFPAAGQTTANSDGGIMKGRGVFPNHDVELATPNEYELAAMHEAAMTNGYMESDDWWTVIDSYGIKSSGIDLRLQSVTSRELIDKGIPVMMSRLLPFIPVIITKLGAQGVLMARLLPKDHPWLTSPDAAPYILSRTMNDNAHVGGLYMRLFTAETVNEKEIISVNGVGDTFLGALVAGLAKGIDYDERLIKVAQKAAVMTLKSAEAVSPDLGQLTAELESISSN